MNEYEQKFGDWEVILRESIVENSMIIIEEDRNVMLACEIGQKYFG